MKKTGRKRSYLSYVEYYKEMSKANKKYGVTDTITGSDGKEYYMNSKMLTKAEWEATFEAEYNARKKAIDSGERKIIGNINRDLAAEQRFEVSEKQAKAQLKAYKRLHMGEVNIEKVKVKDLKLRKYELNFEEMYRIAEELEQDIEKYNGWSLRAIVSSEFFGS